MHTSVGSRASLGRLYQGVSPMLARTSLGRLVTVSVPEIDTDKGVHSGQFPDTLIPKRIERKKVEKPSIERINAVERQLKVSTLSKIDLSVLDEIQITELEQAIAEQFDNLPVTRRKVDIPDELLREIFKPIEPVSDDRGDLKLRLLLLLSA